MKNSVTEAGQASSSSNHHIDAINQCFAVFRRNYHNQYFKAFSDEKELNISKRLWLDSLTPFSPETIQKATKSLIETSEFLPTLASMIQHCEKQQPDSPPDAHTAYVEACRAKTPKLEHDWSHPAVYFAGLETDWFFLSSSEERIAFPVFKKNYEKFVQKHREGVKLCLPDQKMLPEKTASPAPEAVQEKHINNLKNLFEED